MKTVEVAVIRDVTDYENALKRIHQIFNSEPGSDEYYELKLLTLVIENFEAENFEISNENADPIEIIKFVLKQHELKQSSLVGILGDKTNVSKIVNRKRPLTLDMVRKFSEKFNISPELLIKSYRIEA
jgi:HTH-type transcriptional regulator/antitoxin HigA